MGACCINLVVKGYVQGYNAQTAVTKEQVIMGYK